MITVKGKTYELDCYGITPRQAEFIILLAEGYTQRQLAAELGITHQAITSRLLSAKQTLKAKTPAAMVAVCFAEGWMRTIGGNGHA